LAEIWKKAPLGLPRSTVVIEHRWPIGLIYAATCAFWAAYFVRGTVGSSASWTVTSGAELAAALMVVWVWMRLRAAQIRQRKRLRNQVIKLMLDIENWKAAGSEVLCKRLSRAIGFREALFGIGKKDAAARIRHQLKKPYDMDNQRDCSLLLAAVIDLPARWIEDVTTGRR
jgi:hypothetical protein